MQGKGVINNMKEAFEAMLSVGCNQVLSNKKVTLRKIHTTCEPIISDFVASENYACKHLLFSWVAATAPLLKMILHNKCNLHKWKLQKY